MATATPKWRRRGLLYEDTAETAWRSRCLGLTGCGSGTSVDKFLLEVPRFTGFAGGVVKYDRGKVIAGGEFEHTGLLNVPPVLLTNAGAKLRCIHEYRCQ